MRFFFCFIFSVILSARAGATPAPTPTTYGITELLKTIDDNRVTTIEELLPRLPLDLRTNFTLINQSKSLMQAASPESPRALLFGSTGQLVLTFNGGQPTQLGAQTIELLSFDPNSATYQLHEMKFSGSGRPTLSEANPQRCTFCHDTNPRPIWSEYNHWAGVTGEEDDSIGFSASPNDNAYGGYKRVTNPTPADAVRIAQYKAALAFRAKALTHPRYKWLGWSTTDVCYPYHCGPDRSAKSFFTSPNERFTLLNVLNNGAAVANRAAHAPTFEKFKYSLSWGLLCEADELPAVMSKIGSQARMPKSERWTGTFDQWKSEAIQYQAILEFFGIPYGSTSIGLRIDDPGDAGLRAPQPGAYARPTRGALSSDGLATSQIYAGLQILRQVAKTDAHVKQWLKEGTGWNTIASVISYGQHAPSPQYNAPAPFTSYVDSMQGVANDFGDICDYLEDKSDREGSADVSTASATSSAVGLALRPPNWNPGWEILTKSRCISCHDTPGLDAAVKIPFSRPADFARFVQGQAAAGVDFMQLVASYIRSGDDHPAVTGPPSSGTSSALVNATPPTRAQMPYSGAGLNVDEQKILLQYLTQMSQVH